MWKEIIGICGSLLILVGLSFKTTTYKSRNWMRALNVVGSIVFVVYGILVPAISTAVLNGALVVVNTYYLVSNIVKHRKQMKTATNAANEEKSDENQE